VEAVTTGPAAVLPAVDDRDSEGFWAAARRHELAVLVCEPAGHVLHLPRQYCHRCDSFAVRWQPVAGRGTVHTWTVVEHAVDPAFPVPYTIVLVELDDRPGVRFVSDLPGRVDLAVGQPMVVRFDDVDATVTLPRWEPA
jgi:uncharacterized OB-fold protein